jgi:hypothetical protein
MVGDQIIAYGRGKPGKDEMKAFESAIQEIGRKVKVYKTGELRKGTNSARRPLFHIDSNINRFLAQHEGRVHFAACILQLISPTGLLRQFARFEHPRWDFSLGHCTVQWPLEDSEINSGVEYIPWLCGVRNERDWSPALTTMKAFVLFIDQVKVVVAGYEAEEQRKRSAARLARWKRLRQESKEEETVVPSNDQDRAIDNNGSGFLAKCGLSCSTM